MSLGTWITTIAAGLTVLGAGLGAGLGPVRPASAQEFEKAIMTGGATGTYIQIGRDVAGLLSECGQTLEVLETAGSLENFLGVRSRRNTQFGIVQSDVLEYLQTFAADDPAIARAISGVRIAFPLYNEEVHILATRDIADLTGLDGKRVAVGTENSGTFLTSSLILDLAEVQPSERVTINAADALTALNAGTVDAFFYVAGAPTAIFADGTIDAERFHLLPIDDEVLRTVYVPTSIPAGTYPFQEGAIDVVAVKAVLMTYDYDPRKNAYHRESCSAVSDVANLILTRFQQLQEGGHPKWKNVDLGEIPPGWEIGECVNAGLQPAYELACAPAGAAATAGGGFESEANDAYRRRICDVVGC